MISLISNKSHFFRYDGCTLVTNTYMFSKTGDGLLPQGQMSVVIPRLCISWRQEPSTSYVLLHPPQCPAECLAHIKYPWIDLTILNFNKKHNHKPIFLTSLYIIKLYFPIYYLAGLRVIRNHDSSIPSQWNIWNIIRYNECLS